MITAEQQISPEFQVLLRIHEYNLRDEPVWFSKLAESLNSEMDQHTISTILDKADDMCLIEWDWSNIDGLWVRSVRIDRDFEGFIHGLYNSTKEAEAR